MSQDIKTLITVLLLIFFYPAGLVFMWMWMKWPMWLKILLTLGVIIVLLLIPLVIISSAIVINAPSAKP